MNIFTTHPWLEGVFSHLLTIGGFLLAVFLIARLMSEKKQPGNTFAWLLIIILIPYVGVPLYLLIGGRKLRRLVAQKKQVFPLASVASAVPSASAHLPIARTIASGGGTPPIEGNAVTLLTDGQEAFRALENGIKQAKHSIHITVFILGRDRTGRRIVKLLAQRARQGIKVRLLLDAVGCMFLSRDFFACIKRAGGEVCWFMPVLPFTLRGSANLRNHRKIAIFDHALAIVGGHNIAEEYMGPTRYKKRWADFGAQIEGPAVAMLNEIVITDWCFASRQDPEKLKAEISAEISTKPRGQGELQIIPSGPDVNGDPLYEGLIAMVQSAEKSIWIITPYFIPDEVLQRSLIIKARAGCAITLIVPAKSNHPITDFARRHYVRELRHAGVKVMLFGPGMLHSKATIIDDRIALFGSANFDLRSLFVNYEIGVMAHSIPDVLAIKRWAQSLLPSCEDAANAKPQKLRFFNGLAEDLSRLIAPLL